VTDTQASSRTRTSRRVAAWHMGANLRNRGARAGRTAHPTSMPGRGQGRQNTGRGSVWGWGPGFGRPKPGTQHPSGPYRAENGLGADPVGGLELVVGQSKQARNRQERPLMRREFPRPRGAGPAAVLLLLAAAGAARADLVTLDAGRDNTLIQVPSA